MSKKFNKHLYNSINHPILTRRDFLSRIGFGISGSLLPVGSLMATETLGADCPTFQDIGMTPTIIVDLNGGSNLIGSNIAVGKKSQTDFLDSYEVLGLPQSLHPEAFVP